MASDKMNEQSSTKQRQLSILRQIALKTSLSRTELLSSNAREVAAPFKGQWPGDTRPDCPCLWLQFKSYQTRASLSDCRVVSVGPCAARDVDSSMNTNEGQVVFALPNEIRVSCNRLRRDAPRWSLHGEIFVTVFRDLKIQRCCVLPHRGILWESMSLFSIPNTGTYVLWFPVEKIPTEICLMRWSDVLCVPAHTHTVMGKISWRLFSSISCSF